MAVFNALEIGKRGLTAQRIGLDATSSNIANVNTEGYTRKSPVLVETSPLPQNGILIGSGVAVDRMAQVRFEFLDREIRKVETTLAGQNSDLEIVQRVEALLSENSDFALDTSIRNFFSAWNDLSLRPENLDKRKLVTAEAQTLTAHFNRIGNDIVNLRTDVRSRLDLAVNEVNRLVEEVTELNQKVIIATSQGDASGGAFADQRSVAIEKIAAYGDLNVTVNSDNVAIVSLAGTSVVTGGTAGVLEARESIDEVTGERTVRIVQVNQRGDAISELRPRGGRFESMVRHFNETLDNVDSSGNLSVAKDVDTLAEAVVTNVNDLHATGYGLDDTGSAPPGRSFFTPAAVGEPITAASMSVSSDILGSPRDIATAATSGAPGNNEIAQAIADLQTAQDFLDDLTIQEAYSSIVTDIGVQGSNAANGLKTTSLIKDQLFSQRQAVTGVSLDEEAINLIKFQRAFQASARVINTSNEMLESIVNLGR